MATTIPRDFSTARGVTSLSTDVVDQLISEYRQALGNQDKASDIVDESFHAGMVAVYEQVLGLLTEESL